MFSSHIYYWSPLSGALLLRRNVPFLHNRAIIADFRRYVFVISVKFAGKTGKEIERGTDIIFRPAKKKGALSCGGRSLL
jgi:hypothetical protein